jgi:glycine/D-amino acid oxidase-like deaminating enzyme
MPTWSGYWCSMSGLSNERSSRNGGIKVWSPIQSNTRWWDWVCCSIGRLGLARTSSIPSLGICRLHSTKTADSDRIDALLDATRSQLPDLEMIDASACHRPISANDRALIGPVGAEYPNLYLITGLGSRGWTIGLGSVKLLASQMLNLPCDIDPTPTPTRFNLLSRK